MRKWQGFLYEFLERNVLTKSYVQKVKARIQLYNPGAIMTIKHKTCALLTRSFFIGIIAMIYLMFFGGTAPYYVFLVLSVVGILHTQLIYQGLEKEENKLLVQFEQYLSDVYFDFGFHGIVEEAVYNGIDTNPYEIGLQAQVIYEMLMQEEKDEILEAYHETAPNHFFVTFYALCETIRRYGDQKVNGRSLFLKNLGYLKEEIHIELLKRKQLKYLFTGLLGVCMVPMFVMKPLELWSISNLEELQPYYSGNLGMITTVLVMGGTIVCYGMIQRLKYGVKPLYGNSRIVSRVSKNRILNSILVRVINKNYSKYLKRSQLLKELGQVENIKEFMTKQLLFGIAGVLLTTLFCTQLVWNAKGQAEQQISLSQDLSLQLTEEKQEGLKEFIRLQYREHKVERDDLALEQTISEHLDEQFVLTKGEESKAEILQIIQQMILNDGKIGYSMWYLLIALLSGIGFYFYPYIQLLIQKQLFRMDRETEVIRFQTIILILMHIRNASVEMILEWMEHFSNAFKGSIAQTVDALEYEGIHGLELLKEKESFPPYVRIIDGLIACDKMPVYQAFEELESERGYYIDKHKQENEAMIIDKAAIAKVIAFLPLYGVIICKLIIPFVLEGLNQLAAYSSEIWTI